MSAPRGEDEPWQPVNFRADRGLRELIGKAVGLSGLERSHWLREAVEAAAVRELAEAARREKAGNMVTIAFGRIDQKTYGLQQQRPTPCPHPQEQRWVGLRSWTCLECGSTYRRRLP